MAKKGGSVPTTPAMLAYQKNSIAQAQNYMKNLQPAQQIFAANSEANMPAMTDIARGTGVTGSSEEKAAGISQLNDSLSKRGVGLDSGNAIANYGALTDGTGRSAGLVKANLGAARGNNSTLQTITGLGQADENNAMSGENAAANLEQEQAGAKVGQNAATASALGTAGGQGLGLAFKQFFSGSNSNNPSNSLAGMKDVDVDPELDGD